jgi:hypothetical protein
MELNLNLIVRNGNILMPKNIIKIKQGLKNKIKILII